MTNQQLSKLKNIQFLTCGFTLFFYKLQIKIEVSPKTATRVYELMQNHEYVWIMNGMLRESYLRDISETIEQYHTRMDETSEGMIRLLEHQFDIQSFFDTMKEFE